MTVGLCSNPDLAVVMMVGSVRVTTPLPTCNTWPPRKMVEAGGLPRRGSDCDLIFCFVCLGACHVLDVRDFTIIYM